MLNENTPFLMAAFADVNAPDPIAVMPLRTAEDAIIAFFSEPELPLERVRAIYERIDEDTWEVTSLRRRCNTNLD